MKVVAAPNKGMELHLLESLFVLIMIYACVAWTLWRPFLLKVADFVEDRGGQILIRRGTKEVELNYSDIRDHKYLQIGTIQGVKLTFKKPNQLGTHIGFYLPDPELNTGREDSIEYMERQIIKARGNGAGMKKLENEKELVKKAIALGVAYGERRGVVEFEATDSSTDKLEYIYRLLVHDKLIQPLHPDQVSQKSIRRRLAIWASKQRDD